MTVRIEGIPEAEEALMRASERLLGLMAKVVQETTEDVASEARRLAPVDTGKLRGSIETRTGGLDGEVVTDAPYAGYVEFGTSRAPAKPFLTPAAEIHRRRFISGLTETGKAIE